MSRHANMMHTNNAQTTEIRNPLAASAVALAVALLATTLLLTTTAALAQGQPSADRRAAMSERAMERMSSELDLTDAQQKQIEEIRRESRDANTADRARMQELNAARATAENAGQREAISSEIEQINARRGAARASSMSAVQNVLTEEQRAKIAERSGSWREPGAEGRGRGRPDWERGNMQRPENAGRGPRERMPPGRDKGKE